MTRASDRAVTGMGTLRICLGPCELKQSLDTRAEGGDAGQTSSAAAKRWQSCPYRRWFEGARWTEGTDAHLTLPTRRSYVHSSRTAQPEHPSRHQKSGTNAGGKQRYR